MFLDCYEQRCLVLTPAPVRCPPPPNVTYEKTRNTYNLGYLSCLQKIVSKFKIFLSLLFLEMHLCTFLHVLNTKLLFTHLLSHRSREVTQIFFVLLYYPISVYMNIYISFSELLMWLFVSWDDPFYLFVSRKWKMEKTVEIKKNSSYIMTRLLSLCLYHFHFPFRTTDSVPGLYHDRGGQDR